MAQHKVVRRFKELKHDGHIYEVGDNYPVEGKKATKARLEELSTTKNKYQQIFIEEVTETPKDKE
ncbi:termination factor Rho [Lysinibacillus sp. HST-98]|uniref:termination factor Rho n=1 Tax=Lysinibacillus sp. HST-98 TaxID=2800419 RepID=UPI0019254B62|nr:termination factor Rho [Lysinibacillus sp. HST-98]MBL3731555.1 termination factor Rho [Lysinibacillus sp. HST-98]